MTPMARHHILTWLFTRLQDRTESPTFPSTHQQTPFEVHLPRESDLQLGKSKRAL